MSADLVTQIFGVCFGCCIIFKLFGPNIHYDSETKDEKGTIIKESHFHID